MTTETTYLVQVAMLNGDTYSDWTALDTRYPNRDTAERAKEYWADQCRPEFDFRTVEVTVTTRPLPY